MDLAEKVGQLFFLPIPGTKLTLGGERILRMIRPGGVILFSHNFSTAEEARSFISELKAIISPPPLIAIDEEGGSVSRLGAITSPMPSAMAVGATGSEILAYRQGQLTGRLLSFLGVDINFAPVLDLSLGPPENGIGVRSFGSDPDLVIRMGRSYLKGLHREGVAGVVKHFPGLGASKVDSHHELPLIKRKRNRLIEEDISPFRQLLSSPPYPSVMVGHGYYPHLAPGEKLPASLSPVIVSELLRDELGVSGLIFTDDLAMGAVVADFSLAEAAVKALDAGAEVLLTTHPWEEVEEAKQYLISLIERGKLSVLRLESAVNRILMFKRKREKKEEQSLSSFKELSAELEAHSKGVAEKSATIVKAWKKGISKKGKTAIYIPKDPPFSDPLSKEPAPEIKETIKKLLPTASIHHYPLNEDKISSAKCALVVLLSPSIDGKTRASLSRIRNKSSRVFAILLDFPRIPKELSPDGGVAVYFKGAVPLSAGISVLLGELPASGTLPISPDLANDE